MFKINLKKFSTGLVGLDIGFLTAEFPLQSDIENYVTRGHIDFPLTLPKDGNNQTFIESILKLRNINAKQHTQDWPIWSQHKESLYCFPCWIFWNSVCSRLSTAYKSVLTTAEGWPASANWLKLCNRVPEHPKSNGHRECYVVSGGALVSTLVS